MYLISSNVFQLKVYWAKVLLSCACKLIPQFSVVFYLFTGVHVSFLWTEHLTNHNQWKETDALIQTYLIDSIYMVSPQDYPGDTEPHTHTHTHAHARARTHTQTHTRARTHTQTHTRARTHKHARTLSLALSKSKLFLLVVDKKSLIMHRVKSSSLLNLTSFFYSFSLQSAYFCLILSQNLPFTLQSFYF